MNFRVFLPGFSVDVKAMNEATPEASGWLINAGNRRPNRRDHGGSWANVKTIHYENGNEPRCPGLIVERHQDFEGIYA